MAFDSRTGVVEVESPIDIAPIENPKADGMFPGLQGDTAGVFATTALAFEQEGIPVAEEEFAARRASEPEGVNPVLRNFDVTIVADAEAGGFGVAGFESDTRIDSLTNGREKSPAFATKVGMFVILVGEPWVLRSFRDGRERIEMMKLNGADMGALIIEKRGGSEGAGSID